MSTRKAGRREGRAATRGPTGAVAPRGQRGNERRQRRRPLQNTNGSGGERRRAAAVTQSGGRLGERPLQEKGGGCDGGRYREWATVVGGRHRKRAAAIPAAVTGGRCRRRAAAMAAAVTQTMPRGRMPQQRRCQMPAAVAGGGRRRWQRPLHKQYPEAGCLNSTVPVGQCLNLRSTIEKKIVQWVVNLACRSAALYNVIYI
jgi:hypothetical protein